MYIVCVHNTTSMRVFSVLLFVCLVSPFCRIKHVTYVNVNILCCMMLYVYLRVKICRYDVTVSVYTDV